MAGWAGCCWNGQTLRLTIRNVSGRLKVESTEYAALARDSVRRDIVAPLARHGIVIPEAEVSRICGADHLDPGAPAQAS